MTDSTQLEEFRKWHAEHPNIFHWTIKDRKVEILAIHADMDDQKDAQRLVRAMRYRGMDAHVYFRTVSLQSRAGFGVLLEALHATRIDWNDFERSVSFLFFDGEKHITDQVPSIIQEALDPSDHGPYEPLKVNLKVEKLELEISEE